MNLIRKACIGFAVVFALMPALSYAQYPHSVAPFWSNLRNPHRYELGGGIVMPSGFFTGVVRVEDAGNTYKGDTTAKRALPGNGFGGAIGLCLPFKATGHISCWAVAAQLGVNMYSWSDLNQKMGTDGSYKSVSVPLNATTMQVTLPIGVDYKIGNDAILSKRLPFGTSLGIGVMPQLTMTNLEGISGFTAQYGYGCTPYAKMDISLFTGLCWKLRFLYTMGNINLLDVNAKLGNLNDGPFTISSSSQFMASFVIMPFSGGWKEFAWYNTYDTYNQHDRFN
jgi:hypothetical protein